MAMLNAWADGTKPWSFPEVEKSVQEVAQLRMQLLPYIYSTFAQYHFEGKPPFRAMNLVDGFQFNQTSSDEKLTSTDNPYAMRKRKDIKDQYMMGDNIIVAPMFAGEKTRKVYLPKGKWFDFYTGDLVGENEEINFTASLDKIPLFVRDGGIIPMTSPHFQAPKPGEILLLEIRHYGMDNGKFELYDDDGVSFDYEKGSFSKTEITVTRDSSGFLKGTIVRDSMTKPYGYNGEVKWQYMTVKKQ
jgi:alpha-D-xyloside xylohydrolase